MHCNMTAYFRHLRFVYTHFGYTLHSSFILTTHRKWSWKWSNNSTQRQGTIHSIKCKEQKQRSPKQRNISVKGQLAHKHTAAPTHMLEIPLNLQQSRSTQDTRYGSHIERKSNTTGVCVISNSDKLLKIISGLLLGVQLLICILHVVKLKKGKMTNAESLEIQRNRKAKKANIQQNKRRR